ncbi:MAG: glycoside hydrolase family 16 protein [Devosia nanyangense]|uniref:Glycoside hydrolase family 16 protein n=1 Tax=Devosia nanyangense TaxID=1228055 RepID=A0A933L7V0_9HYPH|nr:glycoside hydrolase family 16 protein [Devosia nanyangense]
MADLTAYSLDFGDDFRGPELDRSKWPPFYLPHWSSRRAAAANVETGPNGLVLSIGQNQPPWLPAIDGPIRVSSIQTGAFAGPLGSTIGQHRFNPTLRVKEAQPTERLYVPLYGRFEMRARMHLCPGQLAALWTIGFEDEPERSGEITIMEIFGDSVDAASAELGHGIKAINDPSLVTEFSAPRLPFSPARFHVYAADWDETGVSFYLDERLLTRVEQSPAYPMQFMLNVYELKPSNAPSPRLEVDWFRGYRRKAAA